MPDSKCVADADPPSPPWRAMLALTILLWTINFIVVTFGNWLDRLSDWHARAGGRAVASIGGILICWILAQLLDRLGRWSIRARALTLFVLSIAAGDALSWLSAGGWRIFGGVSAAPTPGTILFNLAYWTWFVLAWGALYLAIGYSYEIRDRERGWAAAKTLAQNAKLRALRYQIRPHFLFNALNAVVSLILERRSREAVTMVRALADFLRISLELDPVEDVRIADELELQALYLNIEKVRFPDLDVSIESHPGVEECLVPTLILQPIVENAVKYSVARSLDRVSISISAKRLDDAVQLLVEDTVHSSTEPVHGLGVGLANVRERLRSRFGEQHLFEAGPRQPSGFFVRILIPIQVAA